jgi:hypothetical protein
MYPHTFLGLGHDQIGRATRRGDRTAPEPHKRTVCWIGQFGSDWFESVRVAGLDALYEANGDFRALDYRQGGGMPL